MSYCGHGGYRNYMTMWTLEEATTAIWISEEPMTHFQSIETPNIVTISMGNAMIIMLIHIALAFSIVNLNPHPSILMLS